LDRLKELGGDIVDEQEKLLVDNLLAIEFNTVLYPNWDVSNLQVCQ